MSASPDARSLRDRFVIGASLLPPVALLMLAARWGWVPVPAWVFLTCMPPVLAVGMLLPQVFEPWHRRVSRGQAWLGRRLVFGLLLGVYVLAVVPIGFLMRRSGKNPLDLSRSGGSWVRSKGYGSLRDPF